MIDSLPLNCRTPAGWLQARIDGPYLLTLTSLYVNHYGEVVNVCGSPKAKILSSLRGEASPVSGSFIGESLGMSRVAVFKQIESLRALGYPIESDRSGYRLSSKTDFLYPWEFPEREEAVRFFEVVDSTMDRAWSSSIAAGNGENLFIAERQSAGRGRRGRTWRSDPGGLFFTVIEPESESLSAGQYSMAAGIALCGLLHEELGLEAGLQWPNDLFVGGKKIGGILIEQLIGDDGPRITLIGIGLNVRNPVHGGATSLERLKPRNMPLRRELVLRFLHRLASINSQIIDRAGTELGCVGTERGYEGTEHAEPDLDEGTEHVESDLAGTWNSYFLGQGRLVMDREHHRLGRAKGIDSMGRIVVDGPGPEKSYGPSQAYISDKESLK
jgi:BirA family biotin operon repressor/biotin-[acetyl-CoA-carboxylase] ligase